MRLDVRLWIAFVLAACAAGPAHGAASASVTLNGSTFVSLAQSGHAFEIGNFVLPPLAPGASFDATYEWTIALAEDGLPATRDFTFCAPLHVVECGPAPTGFELAFAHLVVGYRDGRVANPFIDFLPQEVALQTQTGVPDRLERSGTFHLHAVNTSTVFPASDTYSVYALLFVDAAPVPEPAAWAMLLAGLAALCVVRRSARDPKDVPARAARGRHARVRSG